MKFLTRSNIIPLIEGVVDAIQPYAKSNMVSLIFKPGITELIMEYHPETIIHDITQLLCNVIAFTPQTYHIEMNLNEVVIVDETLYQLYVSYEKHQIQEMKNDLLKIDYHWIPAYYAQISKKLRSHFANPENLEKAAPYKNQTDGVFLQKINALIMSNLEREGFDPDCLCKGMAPNRKVQKLKVHGNLFTS